MAIDDDLISLGPWPLGEDNRSSEDQISQTSLRATNNVTIRANGALTLRDGYDNLDITAAHSLWSDDQVDYALAVRGTSLVRIGVNANGSLAFTELRTGMAGKDYPVGYVCVDGIVYYSNGLVSGRIVGGSHRAWGVDRPSSQPTVAAIASGGLYEGRYQIAITFTDDLGEESGSDSGVLVDVSAGGGIAITNLPQPLDANVDFINVYVTEANGSIFYRYAKLAVGAASLNVSASSTQGKRLQSQFMTPPPPGFPLEVHNGRIFGVNPNYPKLLWYTEAIGYGLFNQGNRLAFEDEVTFLAGVDAGLIVAADKTVILTGTNPKTFVPNILFAYGAPKAIYARNPEDNSILWIGDEGICMANNQGQAVNLTQARIAMRDDLVSGAITYHEADGVKQAIASMRGGVASEALSESYFGATITMRAGISESAHIGSTMSATVT